jgi:HPt (histidine-containing phosphotransfer) domain-containing protein
MVSTMNPQASIHEHVDTACLRKLHGIGGDKLIVELLDSMLDTFPTRWDALHQYVENQRWMDASHQAHSLRSSAGLFGASRLLAQLGRLETEMADRAKRGETQPPPPLKDLDDEYGYLMAYLQAERSNF